MSTIIERLVACIQKPPDERSLEEISSFCEWFGKLNAQFSELKPEVICDILKNSQFSVRPRDNVIIRQFDVGDCFYIILSGKASIYINTDSVPDDEDETVENVEENAAIPNAAKKELDRSKFGIPVGMMHSGKGFGELALINKNSRRNATIIADETTQLVVVNRDLYNRSLKSIQEAEFRAQMDFVNDNKLFRNWPARYKRQAGMSLRKQVFEFGMPIVQQGQPLNGLAFILSGQAKVIVDCLMHHLQYPELRLDEDPEEIAKRESQFAELGDRLIDAKTESQKLWDKPFRRQGYAFVEQRLSQKHLEIALVGPGETIGDIENGLELSTYAQTVICEERTECYVIDAKNFERLLNVKRNPRSVLMLKNQARVKLFYRVERTFQKEIPLLKNLVYRIESEKRQTEKEKLLAEQHTVTVTNQGDLPFDKFIPKQGLLIDMYGPGTVFYRNRIRRENKRRIEKARQHAPGGGARLPGMGGVLFGSGMPPSEDGNNSLTGDVALSLPQPSIKDELDKPEVHQLSEDWETSSQHLEALENRMKGWHEVVLQNLVAKKEKESIFKLKRFKAPNSDGILPGKRVVMRPKTNNHSISINFIDNEQSSREKTFPEYPSSNLNEMAIRWEDQKSPIDLSLDMKAIENVQKENSTVTLPELKHSNKMGGSGEEDFSNKRPGEYRRANTLPPNMDATRIRYTSQSEAYVIELKKDKSDESLVRDFKKTISQISTKESEKMIIEDMEDNYLGGEKEKQMEEREASTSIHQTRIPAVEKATKGQRSGNDVVVSGIHKSADWTLKDSTNSRLTNSDKSNTVSRKSKSDFSSVSKSAIQTFPKNSVDSDSLDSFPTAIQKQKTDVGRPSKLSETKLSKSQTSISFKNNYERTQTTQNSLAMKPILLDTTVNRPMSLVNAETIGSDIASPPPLLANKATPSVVKRMIMNKAALQNDSSAIPKSRKRRKNSAALRKTLMVNAMSILNKASNSERLPDIQIGGSTPHSIAEIMRHGNAADFLCTRFRMRHPDGFIM